MKVTYEARVYKPEHQLLGEGLTKEAAQSLMRDYFKGTDIVPLDEYQWGPKDLLLGERISGIVNIDSATSHRREQLNYAKDTAKDELLDIALKYASSDLNQRDYLMQVMEIVAKVHDAQRQAEEA